MSDAPERAEVVAGLWQEHAAFLRGYARRLCARFGLDRDDAEDVLMRTLETVYRRYDADRGFRAFCAGVLRWAVLHELREQRRVLPARRERVAVESVEQVLAGERRGVGIRHLEHLRTGDRFPDPPGPVQSALERFVQRPWTPGTLEWRLALIGRLLLTAAEGGEKLPGPTRIAAEVRRWQQRYDRRYVPADLARLRDRLRQELAGRPIPALPPRSAGDRGATSPAVRRGNGP